MIGLRVLRRRGSGAVGDVTGGYFGRGWEVGGLGMDGNIEAGGGGFGRIFQEANKTFVVYLCMVGSKSGDGTSIALRQGWM